MINKPGVLAIGNKSIPRFLPKTSICCHGDNSLRFLFYLFSLESVVSRKEMTASYNCSNCRTVVSCVRFIFKLKRFIRKLALLQYTL